MPSVRLIALSRTLGAAVLTTLAVIAAAASYSRNGVWADPVTLWEDSVLKSPDKARPHYNLANVLAEKGRLDEALEENLKAVEIFPSWAHAHFNIGAIYHTRGRTDLAEKRYLLALALSPDLVQAHNNLGYLYQKKGLNEKAAAEYAEALRLNPAHVTTINNMAALHMDAGNTEGAIDLYRTALAHEPYNAAAHYGLGKAYERIGRMDEAAREFQAARELDPSLAER